MPEMAQQVCDRTLDNALLRKGAIKCAHLCTEGAHCAFKQCAMRARKTPCKRTGTLPGARQVFGQKH